MEMREEVTTYFASVCSYSTRIVDEAGTEMARDPWRYKTLVVGATIVVGQELYEIVDIKSETDHNVWREPERVTDTVVVKPTGEKKS